MKSSITNGNLSGRYYFNRRDFFRITIMAILALSLWSGYAWAQMRKMKIAYMPIASCSQLFVALDKGYFADAGLEVEKKPMAGGAVIVPAVEAGDVQIGYSNVVSIIIAHDKGFDFQFLVNGALNIAPDHYANSIVAAADSGIAGLKDLEGKKLAINTLGNINELYAKHIADKYGFDVDKVILRELPFPMMEAALKNKSVDAAIITEPFRTLATKHGVAKMLDKDSYGQFAKRILIASWFGKRSWMEKEPETAKAFIAAMNKAADYINAHKEEMPEIIPRYSKLKADLARQIVWPGFSKEFKKSDLQVMIDYSKKYGFIKKGFDAKEIVSKYITLVD